MKDNISDDSDDDDNDLADFDCDANINDDNTGDDDLNNDNNVDDEHNNDNYVDDDRNDDNVDSDEGKLHQEFSAFHESVQKFSERSAQVLEPLQINFSRRKASKSPKFFSMEIHLSVAANFKKLRLLKSIFKNSMLRAFFKACNQVRIVTFKLHFRK